MEIFGIPVSGVSVGIAVIAFVGACIFGGVMAAMGKPQWLITIPVALVLGLPMGMLMDKITEMTGSQE